MRTNPLAPMGATTVGKSNRAAFPRVHDPRYPIRKDRVEARLKELGIRPTNLAIEAGLQRTFITDLLEGRKHSVNGRNRLHALAAALGCAPEYITGSPEPVPTPRRLEVRGCVYERGYRRAGRPPRVRPALDDRFPAEPQGLYQVHDEALESIGIKRGSWLHVIDADAFLKVEGFRAGQLVLVPQNHHYVVRRLIPLSNRVELHSLDGREVQILGNVVIEAVVLRAITEMM